MPHTLLFPAILLMFPDPLFLKAFSAAVVLTESLHLIGNRPVHEIIERVARLVTMSDVVVVVCGSDIMHHWVMATVATPCLKRKSKSKMKMWLRS